MSTMRRLNIAVGAGQNGSFGHGFDIAGQLQFADVGGPPDLDHFDARQRLFVPVRLAELITALRFCSGM